MANRLVHMSDHRKIVWCYLSPRLFEQAFCGSFLCLFLLPSVESWWAHRDLNPEPRNYEFRALTVEL